MLGKSRLGKVLSSCVATLLAGTAVVLALTITQPAAGASTASTDVPVVFVHGFFADKCPGLDVAAAMHGPMLELAASGWDGAQDVVSYYTCDVGGTRIGNDTVNTPIEKIAQQLAWYLYKTYTSRGQTVDVVAHSMGGLIIRAALQYTQNGASGFPRYLLVDRVVTFSAPFTGIAASTTSAVPGLTGTYQAGQVIAGSNFLRSLTSGPAPDGSGGTDWMVVGSSGGCDIVPGLSAVALPEATTVLYTGCWNHTQYLYDWTQTPSYPARLNGNATMAYGPLELMRIFLTMPMS